MVGIIVTNLIICDIAREFLPQQLEIMKAVKKYRYILYSGAVRAGKTLLAANIAIRMCIENAGCTGMMGSLTTPQMTRVVFKTFIQELELYQDALDKAGIPITLAKITYSKGDMKAKFWNGSEIWFISCEDETKIRGMTLDFVCLDEPVEIDETIFKQLMNRISGGHTKNQFILLTTNPASQSHWIYQYFFVKPTEEYYTVETTTYDNVLLPNYKKYITNLEDNLDDDWIRRFLNGRWGAYSGQIYKEFDLEKHVGDYSNFKDFDYIIAGVDWGMKNPTCILTCGITKEKDVMIIEEFYESGNTTVKIAEKIADLHKHYKYKKVYCDPSQPDLILQTRDLKVPIEKADNDVTSGIGKVKSILKTFKLHIDKSCKNTINEFQSYRYEKDKMNHNPTEKPVKEDDHSCDALRYALTSYRSFRELPVLGFVKRSLWEFGETRGL